MVDVIHRFRRPEYTAENRCVPCTVVNVLMTFGIAGVIGWFSFPLGIAALVIGLAAIWLRGYLIPGTPRLTERYLPKWIAKKFEHGTVDGHFLADEGDEIDKEGIFIEAGIIEECRDVDDLCLVAEFKEGWQSRFGPLHDEEAQRNVLADLLDSTADSITIDSYVTSVFVRYPGGNNPRWESPAVLIADLAGAAELPRWIDEWDSMRITSKAQLLFGLRLFLEQCPDCGGSVSMGTRTVKSCCRSRDVIASRCDDCKSTILEITPPDEFSDE